MTAELKIDFSKSPDGLVPAVVQDAVSSKVLMLGFMNAEAFRQTCDTSKVTFYSRSRKCIWVKGESSGNFLNVKSMAVDCDQDSILIQAIPEGPTCHTGSISCFQDDKGALISFLVELEELLIARRNNPEPDSYSSALFEEKLARSAQKVGEEGVEVAIAALGSDDSELISEVADLWFHSLLLLVKKGIKFQDVILELRRRNKIDRKEDKARPQSS